MESCVMLLDGLFLRVPTTPDQDVVCNVESSRYAFKVPSESLMTDG